MQDKFISVTTNSFSSPYGLDKKRNGERYLINSSEIKYIRETEDGKLAMVLQGETVIHIDEKFDEIQSMLIKSEAESELLELVSGQNGMTIDTRVAITNTNLKRVLCDIPSHESTPFGLFNRLIVEDTNDNRRYLNNIINTANRYERGVEVKKTISVYALKMSVAVGVKTWKSNEAKMTFIFDCLEKITK